MPATPRARAAGEHEGDAPDQDDEELELSPEKGNVAFASAADGWAFRTGQFAALYVAKLGFSAAALQRALWGDFRLDAKAKRIARIRPGQQGRHKPLFVQARACPHACQLAAFACSCAEVLPAQTRPRGSSEACVVTAEGTAGQAA